MSEGMYRLVYYSRNRIGGPTAQVASELRDILAASRRNNARAEVTGALIFNAGCFGQVLEGPRRAVEATFERIQMDERHGEVSLLKFDAAEERAFPDWSMGFVGADEESLESYGKIGTDSGFDPSRMSGDALFETLQRLAREEERV